MLTLCQQAHVRDVLERRRRDATVVDGTFKINNTSCLHYLGVDNNTLYHPHCTVLEVDLANNRVFIEAVFFGAGFLSVPKRQGWVPAHAIIVDFPFWYYFSRAVKNCFTRDLDS